MIPEEAIADVTVTLRRILEDAESQHPGGWGPDVTTVADLRDCLAILAAARSIDVERPLDAWRLKRAMWNLYTDSPNDMEALVAEYDRLGSQEKQPTRGSHRYGPAGAEYICPVCGQHIPAFTEHTMGDK